MGLNEQLMADLKDAMKRRQEVRVPAIRMARVAIANDAIAKGRPLEEGEIQAVLSRQVEQRREAIEEFARGNRPDLVAREQEELEVLLAYLPHQMSREEMAEAARSTCSRWVPRDPTISARWCRSWLTG